jgi:hypothetical protein
MLLYHSTTAQSNYFCSVLTSQNPVNLTLNNKVLVSFSIVFPVYADT